MKTLSSQDRARLEPLLDLVRKRGPYPDLHEVMLKIPGGFAESARQLQFAHVRSGMVLAYFILTSSLCNEPRRAIEKIAAALRESRIQSSELPRPDARQSDAERLYELCVDAAIDKLTNLPLSTLERFIADLSSDAHPEPRPAA